MEYGVLEYWDLTRPAEYGVILLEYWDLTGLVEYGVLAEYAGFCHPSEYRSIHALYSLIGAKFEY